MLGEQALATASGDACAFTLKFADIKFVSQQH
jgi:hypothetical protein